MATARPFVTISDLSKAETFGAFEKIVRENPKQLSIVLNQTARRAKGIAGTEVIKVLNINKDRAIKDMRYVLSSPSKLISRLTAKRRGINLGAFKGVRQTKAGITVKTRKDKPALKIQGGFFFQPGLVGRRKNRFGYAVNPNVNYPGLPDIARFPIDSLYGPSVVDIFGERPVLTKVKDDSREYFFKQMARRINRLIATGQA